MTGNLSWKNSIYELATTMSFETAKTDAAYITNMIYVPQVGDIIRMVTNVEIFRGVITKVDDGDKDVNKYTIVDLGWYLNKTTQTYQFKNITASNAIKELCTDLVINIVSMPDLTANINKIYFDKTISAILTDILSSYIPILMICLNLPLWGCWRGDSSDRVIVTWVIPWAFR